MSGPGAQDQRIRDLLATVLERNPFHRARLAGRSPAALDELPPLSKAELVHDQRRQIRDMVVIRGMNVFPSAVDEAVRNTLGAGDHHLVFYTDPSGMEEVKLEVELASAASARALHDTMRQQLGLRVRVVPVGHGVLRRSGRRAGRVTDLRGRQR
jgi:hypothetical protein